MAIDSKATVPIVMEYLIVFSILLTALFVQMQYQKQSH